MLNRRDFLTRSLGSCSLLALGSTVPQFIANTAQAAETGKDTILVVLEMNGGNDGLNTVIPHGDDLYHKNRPTLHYTKDQVVTVTDHIGLNPGLRSFDQLLKKNQLAIVQGVGYPNPDRSHFESMDIWQTADPQRKVKSGWLGRSTAELSTQKTNIPVLHVGRGRLPEALRGGPGGAVSLNNTQALRLDLGGGSVEQQKERRRLIEDLAKPEKASEGNLLDFVQRRQVQTLSSIDRLQEVLRNSRGNTNIFRMDGGPFARYPDNSLPVKLDLVAQLIAKNFGTRIYYLMIDGFDTHSSQLEAHRKLMAEVADGITNFFNTLQRTGHDQRVRLMTFSEFGRRVQENGSKGTDHGAGSCLFVAGPSIKGGLVGEHPSLKDLDSGDLKYHTDFRRIYATMLDCWLNVDSLSVLGGKYPHIDALKGKA
jgi:uncharacterized protein (DUF1501 family)